MAKITLSIHQKAGAPGYGSDGAGAELEIELDEALADNPDAIAQFGAFWYGALERMVAEQLKRMQAKHPEPVRLPEPAPAPAPAPRGGGDDYDGPPSRRTNGHRQDDGPPSRSASGETAWEGKPPTTGGQLIAWAGKNGKKSKLFDLAKQHNLGQVKDLGRDDVDWLHRELSRQPARYGSDG